MRVSILAHIPFRAPIAMFLGAFCAGIFISIAVHADTQAHPSRSWATSPPPVDARLLEIYREAVNAEQHRQLQTARDSYSLIITSLSSPTPGSDTNLLMRAVYRRAVVAYQLGDTSAAALDFDSVISNPSKGDGVDRAAYFRGRIAQRSGDHRRAIQLYREVTSCDMSDMHSRLCPQAHLGLAECYSVLHDTASAESARRDLIDKHPDSPEAQGIIR